MFSGTARPLPLWALRPWVYSLEMWHKPVWVFMGRQHLRGIRAKHIHITNRRLKKINSSFRANLQQLNRPCHDREHLEPGTTAYVMTAWQLCPFIHCCWGKKMPFVLTEQFRSAKHFLSAAHMGSPTLTSCNLQMLFLNHWKKKKKQEAERPSLLNRRPAWVMNFLGKKMNSVYKPPWDLLQVVQLKHSGKIEYWEGCTLSLLYLSNGLEGNKHFLLRLHSF